MTQRRGDDAAPSRRKPAASFLALFGYAWLMIGLFTGTLVLVVVVRGLISALQQFGLGADAENRVLVGVILAFVFASFLLTRSVVKRVYRVSSIRARRLAFSALVIPGALSMWAWSDPTRVLAGIAGGESTRLRLAGGPEFVFGPYPQPERLAELKRGGFTAVVSLQHPGVLVEVQGIAREKEAARRLGLELIQAPMLPWVSDNAESLEKIRALARTGRGKYYVHCGLGRDRVNVVKRVVESMALEDVRLGQADDLKEVQSFATRGEPFERGRLFEIRPGAWLVPLPNEAELAFTVFGSPGRVVAVLDPADPLHREWLDRAKREFHSYAIPFATIPFTESDAGSPQRTALLINRLRSEPGPLTIVVHRTPFSSAPSEPRTRIAQIILQAFDTRW
jgi:hypothetical protein